MVYFFVEFIFIDSKCELIFRNKRHIISSQKIIINLFCDLRPKAMANDQTFGFKIVKITLIILNALVVVAITWYMPNIFMRKDVFLIAFVFFLGEIIIISMLKI